MAHLTGGGQIRGGVKLGRTAPIWQKMRNIYSADIDLPVVVDRLSLGKHGCVTGNTAVVRSLMSQESALKLENGLLYRSSRFVPVTPSSQVKRQLVVPK